ncbi:MAG: ribonucleoside-diphosphate reductase subunit alpha [bacterium]|nr:ribonucleoside-diphosphate reductase subunit alpha [bacterium]
MQNEEVLSQNITNSKVGINGKSGSAVVSKQKTGTVDPNLVTVVKRNGVLVPFRSDRIAVAVESAFRETKNIPRTDALSQELYKQVQETTKAVVFAILEKAQSGASVTVEGIEDIVEIKLMEMGHLDVAKNYIIFREDHKKVLDDSPRNLKIERRDGTSVRFNPMKIAAAIEKAFRATNLIDGPTPGGTINNVNLVASRVVAKAVEMAKIGRQLTIELIQDEVERQLMAEGFYNVAKDYIIYRSERAKARKEEVEVKTDTVIESKVIETKAAKAQGRQFKMTKTDGTQGVVTEEELRSKIKFACQGLEKSILVDEILELSISNFYDGIKQAEVDLSNVMAAKSRIEAEPDYSQVAARLLLDIIYKESVGVSASDPRLANAHKIYLKEYVKKAITLGRVDAALLEFDLDKLGAAINLTKDLKFTYLGLQTLYDRYLIHDNQVRLETPQIFFMRVAMGLAQKEGAVKNERAIEFYETLSDFHFMSSTPTLFNSGTQHPQLSSCYLSTVMDDLQHIFKVVSDDALLSKWAGGLGNDWTNVRSTGALIKGTNGLSQGVIPFLKVANDTAVAVNQGGKRKGAMCAYLETWHMDIEDFLELRKNTGDERRRTHDMNTANWIPDLFMKRVEQNGTWTLFSPSDAPDLHDLYGAAFEKRYAQYEKMTETGEVKIFKKVEALQLWRKMLGMVFETGHPWITFKDPSNVRSPQDHVGVVHSSNLCTEILLNTSKEETAVCNLGSINLAFHIKPNGEIDKQRLEKTVKTAVRMLDNVIDINFYPTVEAKTANLRHRPIGLGLMGFQDALYMKGISYASPEAVKFADESMELISYFAILASSELAKERGTYQTYKGSKWDRGLLPLDTIQTLKNERGGEWLDVDTTASMDWTPVRESVKKYGMRNSNTMAIAPTATISNITGAVQSIEPTYKHLYAKSNLSGEFTVPNVFLVLELKKRGLWDSDMIDDLKYFDGVLTEIDRVPDDIKKIYVTAFEIEPDWIIECASRRQKWLDMGQSLNLYLSEPNGKKLHDMYMRAWKKGLKTTYYLRSLGATQIEKSTTDINKRALQPRWMKNKSASSNVVVDRAESKSEIKVCNMEEGCESCQ